MAIDKNDYYYYLHKTNISDYKTIESMFNEGLKSRYNYSINSTLARIHETDLANNGLQSSILSYLGDGEEYDSVVVIKIPKKYFGERLHSDGTVDSAVPMFREYREGEGQFAFNALFTPKLIQGVYCRDINKSFTNPNFCPVFVPDGNQYSNEQIHYFEGFSMMDWKKYALDRRKCPFQQLYTSDKSNNTWDKIVNYYSNLYGITPRPKIQYKMTEEEKRLFGGGIVL